MSNIKTYESFGKSINEANSSSFKYPNEPSETIEDNKEWIRNNPHIARRDESESDFFEIEVFGYNHKQEADELYKALKDSGYLDTHPLFSIKIEPMQ